MKPQLSLIWATSLMVCCHRWRGNQQRDQGKDRHSGFLVGGAGCVRRVGSPRAGFSLRHPQRLQLHLLDPNGALMPRHLIYYGEAHSLFPAPSMRRRKHLHCFELGAGGDDETAGAKCSLGTTGDVAPAVERQRTHVRNVVPHPGASPVEPSAGVYVCYIHRPGPTLMQQYTYAAACISMLVLLLLCHACMQQAQLWCFN